MVDVSFGDKVAERHYRSSTGANSTWAGPPAGNAWTPGGRLGGLLEASRPGGTLDGYLADLDTIAANLATAVNAAYPAAPSSRPARPGRRRRACASTPRSPPTRR